MRYTIGDLVKYIGDSKNTYIVIATKEHPLTINYLKSKSENFNIGKLENLAKLDICVTNGFDYKISKLLSYHDEITEIDDISINVFEGDIGR